jgi:predicted ATPase
LPPVLLEQILAKTDGVPLFVEELTKSILESGELTLAGDRYDYTGSARSVAIPATLRDSLMARLDRYVPVKEIAQIGAAIGREFSYELITAVASLPQVQLDHALTQLTGSGLAFRRGTPPEATYTFKHALVQDAAYDSLLKSRRQTLHGEIAKVLEERFPQTRDTEPEVLAHHLTEAGVIEAAIPLWLEAGKRAARASANAEAYANLNAGLALLASLPEGADRDARELDLQMALIDPIMSVKGYSAPEIKAASERAIALCRQTGDTSRLFPALYAQWRYQIVRANLGRAKGLAADYLALASSQQAPLPRLVGHRMMGTSLLHGGSLTIGMDHLDQAWALYDPARDAESAFTYGGDVGVTARMHQAFAACLSGYPDRAEQLAQQAVARARDLEHASTLALALYTTTLGAFVLRDRLICERQISELKSLSDEHRLPLYKAGGMPLQGAVLGWQGRPREGLERVERGSEILTNIQFNVYRPSLVLIQVGLLRDLGRAQDALAAIAEVFEVISATQEHWCDAELHRVRGEIYASLSRESEAEAEYSVALAIAREQQARWWELCAAVSLAGLWQEQGKRKEAHDLLAPVYNWFTEGFDTKDLKEAKALLDELES